ncbi:MAG: alpha-L-fucosidase [Clostridia bacterium]
MENLRKYLKKIDDVIEHGKFKDNWESLANHPVPTWYRNAKFGIFVHWGPYSVPAYGSEWYSRNMYKKEALRKGLSMYEHHLETFGAHKDFGYKDFIPMFTADKFEPAKWADLFKKSGAKFVMPVAEHHDGFQMYDSELSEWCATKMGPKKDILAMLKSEIESRDMVFAASSHRVEHYWFMCGMRDFESDIPNGGDIPYGHIYWPSMPEPFDQKKHPMAHRDIDVEVDELFMEDWLARTCEIVDKYQPKIIYFDWWIQVAPMKPYLKKFMAYYYNRADEWGAEVTVNYKHDAFAMSTGVSDIERGQLADVSPYFWQNDTAVAKNSWCYTEGNDYKTPYDILCDLIDVVSKNGSLMLNVGPKADGTIPEEDTKILTEIGKWLEANGEAIYNSYPYKIYGEGPTKTVEGHHTDILRKQYTEEDYRFTSKSGKIYVFAMKWPEDGILKIKTLGKRMGKFNAILKKVSILGENRECDFFLCDNYLSVIGGQTNSEYPVCLQLDIE